MDSGKVTAEYGANWIGCYNLLDRLARTGIGDVAAYQSARDPARAFILGHPMVAGYWTDLHTDTPVNSSTYKSNMSKSNAALYILDDLGFDPDWRTHIPSSSSGPRGTSLRSPLRGNLPRSGGPTSSGSRTPSSTRWTTSCTRRAC
jgi:hypothetical protein